MSQNPSDILTHCESGVMTITLNRVDKKNSITAAMYGAMADALVQAEADPAIRAVVVFPGEVEQQDVGDEAISIARDVLAVVLLGAVDNDLLTQRADDVSLGDVPVIQAGGPGLADLEHRT